MTDFDEYTKKTPESNYTMSQELFFLSFVKPPPFFKTQKKSARL